MRNTFVMKVSEFEVFMQFATSMRGQFSYSVCLVIFSLGTSQSLADETNVPYELRPWLQTQQWVRENSEPIVQLGKSGQFDDMHLFAPCVVHEDRQYRLFYCGSRGSVEQ